MMFVHFEVNWTARQIFLRVSLNCLSMFSMHTSSFLWGRFLVFFIFWILPDNAIYFSHSSYCLSSFIFLTTIHLAEYLLFESLILINDNEYCLKSELRNRIVSKSLEVNES